MAPYYTAFAYRTDDGTHRRAQRRYASMEGAQQAAQKLAPGIGWEWVQGGRGAARPTDWEGGTMTGDWVLVVRTHRAPNLR